MLRSGLVTTLLVALAAGHAQASPADVFGLGSRASAQAGAVTASVTDFSAVFYNPAGLAFSDTTELGFGVLGFGSGLSIRDRRMDITDPIALEVGGRIPVPLGGVLARRLFLAFALTTPPSSILRIISRYPQEPFFPLYDNRTQRLVVMPALAVRVTDRLALGVGVNYLAGLAGYVQGTTGASRSVEPRVDEAVPAAAAVHAGVRWDARPYLSLGLAFRQGFSIPFKDVSDVIVAGQPLSLAVSSVGLYTPDELVGGATLRLRTGTTLGLDVTWARWSAWQGPFIRVTSTLPLAGDLVGELPNVPFSDIVTVHLGLDQIAYRKHGVEVRVRGGYGFDPSPIPDAQPGVTNLFDGSKHTITLGAGLRASPTWLPRPVTLDVHCGVQTVGSRTYTKHLLEPGETVDPFRGLRDEVKDTSADPSSRGVQISNAGYPSINGGGFVWAGSFLLGVEL
jgi:long-chain fatty acid transport protein